MSDDKGRSENYLIFKKMFLSYTLIKQKPKRLLPYKHEKPFQQMWQHMSPDAFDCT